MRIESRARAMPLAAFAIHALLISSCAPTVIWTAKSPDRRHDFQVRQPSAHNEVCEVWKDGKRLGRHAGVALATLALSPKGGHWAYAARKDSTWYLLSDVLRKGRDLGAWDGIGNAQFSPTGERLAFTAERRGSWQVVVDGEAGPGFDAILAGTLRFDPQGVHYAYVAQRGGKTTVVRDRAPGGWYDGVASLAFSLEGGHLAYAAREGKQAFVVCDGKPGRDFDAVTEIGFFPTGDRIAYLARRGSDWHAVVEGIESLPYAGLRDLAIHPDGNTVAFVAVSGAGECVVRNGMPESVEYAAIRPGSLAFRAADGNASYIASTSGGKWTCVLDGKGFGSWDEISGFSRSPDGAQLGFAARNGAHWGVYADGVEIATEAWAGKPVFGPDGAIAYPARRKGRESVIVGGHAYAFDLILDDTFQFGRRGSSWGCIGGARGSKAFFFIIDGERGRDLDLREIVALNQQGIASGQEKTIRSWVAAEIELGASRLR